MEEENDFGEVAALDFGGVAFFAAEVAAFGPEPVAGSGGGAAGAAFSLVGTGAADRFQLEGADAAFGIVASDAGDTAVDDVADAIDCDAGLGDVGGDDDFSE